MFSNVINVGKNIANKINNTFMNLSDIEAKIKEATNDEPWGPQGLLMKEISDETFSSLNFNEIMTFLWYRMFTEKPQNKRRIYKGLVLLSYMLINGSDYVTVRCKDHIGDIQRLEIFSDSNGIPDAGVRKKASDVCDLLRNNQRLQTERDKARNNQQKLYGPNSVVTTSSMDSDRPKSIEMSLGDFDSWQPRSKSIPFVIGESFVSFVNTFTQNISGPPPTETHDNFELPSHYDVDPIPLNDNYKTQQSSSTVDYHRDTCSIIDNRIAHEAPIQKIGAPIQIIDNEVPIIDFSEPAPTADGIKTDFDMEFSNSINSAWTQEDDFGDFRTWNNDVNKLPDKTINNSQTIDFFTDFDSSTRPSNNFRSVNDRNIPSKVPEKANESNLKSGPKVGSTWNDIGSLKIDLDNVCGGLRPMYSKS